MLIKCILNLEKFRNNFWKKKILKICEKHCENMEIIYLFLKSWSFSVKIISQIKPISETILTRLIYLLPDNIASSVLQPLFHMTVRLLKDRL